MDFPTKLKLVIKLTRSSQQKIADAIGISQGMVSRWANGRDRPDAYQAWAMAKYLEVSLDYLMDEGRGPVTAGELRRDRDIIDLIADLGRDRVWQRLIINDPGIPVVNVPPVHETLPPSPTGAPAASPALPGSGPRKSSR